MQFERRTEASTCFGGKRLLRPDSKVGGKSKYLYRAVDSTGQTIDFC